MKTTVKELRAQNKLPEVTRRRLLKHADFIAKLKPHKLNMGLVARSLHEGQSYYEESDPTKMDPFHCKSVACAMGWTPVTFPDLMEWKLARPDDCELAVRAKRKRGLYDYDAMEWLFEGVPPRHLNKLFGSGETGYETPKEVAKGLRYYAETGQLPEVLRDGEDEEDL